MIRKISGFLVVITQLLIVGSFFMTVNDSNVSVEKQVSTIHNENLHKIANSVSLLFLNEDVSLVSTEIVDLTLLEELPSMDVVVEEEPKEEVKEEKPVENVYTPLYSIDASKYMDNVEKGFKVTENNKHYDLSDEEFDVVVAVVAGEYDKNLNDALAVVSVILNRCDSNKWNSWAGVTPYDQVIMKGQFEVYYSGMYLAYMPDGKKYGTEKYEVARQAVLDGLNGIRNNEYLGFRAWWITNYSDKYIVSGGNRYGYN